MSLLLALAVAPTSAHAEDPSQRQLEFCWQELEAERYEQARTSANSAWRLDPTTCEAMVCRAEAFAAEDQLDERPSGVVRTGHCELPVQQVLGH